MTTGGKIIDGAITVAGIGASVYAGDAPGAIAQAMAAVKNFVEERQQVHQAKWCKGLFDGKNWEGKTPQEIQGLIEAKLRDDAKAKDAIWQAAKAIIDCISDRSAEIIGSLTAEQVRGGEIPNVVFRGAIRTFAELSTEEIEVLSNLVSYAVKQSGKTVTLIPQEHAAVEVHDQRDPRRHKSKKLGEPHDFQRVLRLLKSNDICIEVITPNPAVKFDKLVLELLSRHIK